PGRDRDNPWRETCVRVRSAVALDRTCIGQDLFSYRPHPRRGSSRDLQPAHPVCFRRGQRRSGGGVKEQGYTVVGGLNQLRWIRFRIVSSGKYLLQSRNLVIPGNQKGDIAGAVDNRRSEGY